LSPDSGDQSVALLCQISQQLPNFPNGTCSAPQAGQSFSPGASIIWVNAMWMMSLLLGLTSALIATLLQQWARRYVQMPQIPSEPKDRARVRSFLFFGTQKYRVPLAVETAPAILHLSVFLFFAGLVVLFFSINKAVAIIVSISVGIFVVAYLALTILPYIDHNCPYRTPMSYIWWYISHPSLFLVSLCFRGLFSRLHSCIVPRNLGEVTSLSQRIILPVLNTFKRAVDRHWRRLKRGVRETIVQGALKAPEIDDKALTWWLQLPALAEESKAQDFFACIPRQTIAQFMCNPKGKHVFSKHLLTLLRSCGPGSFAIGLNENDRQTRQLVCLHTIHCIALDSVRQNSYVDVEFTRSNFAEIGLMQKMWVDSNAGIRVTSRSICALLARCLLRRLQTGLVLGPALRWLQGVIPNMVLNADIAMQDQMNLKAFVYGVLAHQEADLPAEHATSFTETLAILMDAGTQSPFDRTKFQEKLSALIEQTMQDGTARSFEVVGKLGRMFADVFPASTPAAARQP
jgi:hypothetical protein